MTETSAHLVDDLVARLQPTRPMRGQRLYVGASLWFALAAAWIVVSYGARPELGDFIAGSQTTSMAVLKPLMFLAVAAGGFWAIVDQSRPEGRLRLRTLAPLLAALSIELIGLARDLLIHGLRNTFVGAFGQGPLCFFTILVGGLVGQALLWRFWLARAAPASPRLLGALSGLASSSLMAAAYAIHCNMDAPVYLLVIYGSAIAVSTVASASVGRRILRW